MPRDELGSVEKIHCNSCLQRTNHEVLLVRKHREDEVVEDGQFIIDYTTTWSVLECRGCGSLVLFRYIWSDVLGEQGDADQYPPPISRQAPRWRWQLPEEYRELMNEIYAALHAGSKRLALMGERTLVDKYLMESVGDIGGFEQKLEAAVNAGVLSKSNKEILSVALEAGHAAAHRGHLPTADDLDTVIDIVENLLQPMALARRTAGLKARTPPRGSPLT